MKNRKLAFFGACFVLSLSVAPFYNLGIQAYAANTIVELTPAQTLALFGSSIDAEYNVNLNEYDSCTFQYVGYVNNVFDSSTLTDSDFLTSYTVANSYTYLVYACFDTAYLTSVQYTDFQFELYPSVSITDLSFFRTSVLYGITSNSNNNSGTPAAYPSVVNLNVNSSIISYPGLTAASPYQSFRGWIRSAQGAFPFPDGYSSTQYVFGAISCTHRDTDNFSINDIIIDLFGMTQFTSTDPVFDDCYLVLIQCPLLSDGFQTGGGGGSVTPGTGIGQGSIDSDGNISITIPDYSSQLDAILDKLDQIAANQGYDDLTQDQIAASDSLDSASDVFNSDFEEYYSAEESLYDNFNADSALNDWSYPEFDSSVLESSTFYTGLFDVQIIATMMWIVLSLSTIGFILFGKW